MYDKHWPELEIGSTRARSSGSSMQQVVHVNVFLKNIDDFEAMNRAFREYFGGHAPARTVVAVSALPRRDALLTMNLNAVVGAASDQRSPDHVEVARGDAGHLIG